MHYKVGLSFSTPQIYRDAHLYTQRMIFLSSRQSGVSDAQATWETASRRNLSSGMLNTQLGENYLSVLSFDLSVLAKMASAPACPDKLAPLFDMNSALGPPFVGTIVSTLYVYALLLVTP
jgi:hypothetical protein